MHIPDPSLSPVAANPNLTAHSRKQDAALGEKFGFDRSDLAGDHYTHAAAKASCPHDAAPQRFTILGVLLMFCRQISQAARKVHYSWSGEDLWLRTHHPPPAREPGSPRKGSLGRRKGVTHTSSAPPPPRHSGMLPEGTSPGPWGSDCFHLFLAFPPHPAAVGTARPPREGEPPPPCPAAPAPRRA